MNCFLSFVSCFVFVCFFCRYDLCVCLFVDRGCFVVYCVFVVVWCVLLVFVLIVACCLSFVVC